jgi:hypothetical protein
MRTSLILLSLAHLVALASPAAPPDSTADRLAPLLAAASAFYTEIHTHRDQGLPSEENLQRLKALVTPGLHASLQRARIDQQRQIESHPDEKPDWIEGDLFSSLFEGVKQWKLGEAFHTPGVDATVKVHLTYSEPSQPPVTWTDTLVFKQRDQSWLLSDIRMGGDWAFKSGDSLRARLPGGFKEDEDHTSLDQKWQVTFQREQNAITQITIQQSDQSSTPQILFGQDPNATCPFPTWIIWSPACDKLALHLGTGPHFTSTVVYRLKGKEWQPLQLPKFYPQERKTLLNNGFRERQCLIDAEHWQDNNTLVVQYFGNFTKNDEGDGFSKFISIRFDPKGRPTITEAVDTPGNP